MILVNPYKEGGETCQTSSTCWKNPPLVVKGQDLSDIPHHSLRTNHTLIRKPKLNWWILTLDDELCDASNYR